MEHFTSIFVGIGCVLLFAFSSTRVICLVSIGFAKAIESDVTQMQPHYPHWKIVNLHIMKFNGKYCLENEKKTVKKIPHLRNFNETFDKPKSTDLCFFPSCYRQCERWQRGFVNMMSGILSAIFDSAVYVGNLNHQPNSKNYIIQFRHSSKRMAIKRIHRRNFTSLRNIAVCLSLHKQRFSINHSETVLL